MRPPSLVLALAAIVVLPGFDWPAPPEGISAAMRDARPARRRELLREAAAAADPAVRALVVAALDDADPAVRLEAATLAARNGLTDATPALLRWLDDASADLRLAATRALGSLRARSSLASLSRMLSDADVGVRVEAVRAVAAVGGSDAAVTLVDRLSDPEASVRVETARALGDLGDRRAVFTLLGALQDSAPEVRAAAAVALGRSRDPRALRALVTLLHDPVVDVRVAGVRALGAVGRSSPEAVADLAVVALRESREWEPAAQTRVALEAIETLRVVGGAAACDVLVDVIHRGAELPDRTPVRAAFRALAGIGAPARERVGAIVAATAPGLQEDLIELLATLGGDDAARALLRMIDRADLQPTMRSRAVVALGRTGSAMGLLALMAEAERAPSTGRAAPDRECPRPRVDPAALDGLAALAERAGTLGPDALDLLVALNGRASQGCARQSAQVVALLGRTGNPRASVVIRSFLAAPSERVRRAALAAMSRSGVHGAEGELAALLTDRSPELRLAASDALSRYGDADALSALVDRWLAGDALDRAGAARAIGRVLGRVSQRDPRYVRAVALMADCSAGASPATAAACVDALADAASGEYPPALDALFAALARDEDRSLPALEALANLRLPTGGSRARTVARLDEVLARHALRGDRVAAARSWVDATGRSLLDALAHAPAPTAANAIRAFSRWASADWGSSEVSEALWQALRVRHHEAVLVNAALALAAHPNGSPDLDAALALLAHHPSARVREAAAVLTRACAESSRDEAARPRLASALDRCAADDPSARVRGVCRGDVATVPAGPPAAIDARVVGEGGAPAAFADYALVLPGAWIRMGTTGPDGWVHERNETPGAFLVLDPSELSGD